jgi:gliding motility-associated-like protein
VASSGDYADLINVPNLNTVASSGDYADLINVPDLIDDSFELFLVVDDDGTGNGIITEINEDNNTFSVDIELLIIPDIQFLPNVLLCDEGFNSAVFNLIELVENNLNITSTSISFYETLEDLENEINAISVPEFYNNITDPQTIFLRVETSPCYEIYQFNIMVENCPPYIPDGFSPGDDTKNDWFNIQGLYTIFENHQLLIYNRYGTLIFEGDDSKPWLGITNRGINNRGKLVPVGTYFYVLHLNDPNYKSLNGWVYVNY